MDGLPVSWHVGLLMKIMGERMGSLSSRRSGIGRHPSGNDVVSGEEMPAGGEPGDRDIAMLSPGPSLPAEFYERDAVVVAPALIGTWLQVGSTGGIIVETEAYRRDDAASHSYRGETPRNGAMFGPPGRAYVYRSYGMHWCFNVVCQAAGAVLIRAILPAVGIDEMRRRRQVEDLRKLCSGPGRLASALAIDGTHDRHSLAAPPFLLAEAMARPAVVCGRRIGISRDVARDWRFGLKGTRFVSRPFG